MQKKLQVKIPAKPAYSYPILIEPGLLKNWQNWLEGYMPSDKVIIISDSNIADLYARHFCIQLVANGYKAELLIIPAGEAAKTIEVKLQLEEQMFAFGCDRYTLCIALGGGVVGDLTGFTAATYMRGINYIQLPTSILAMLDSSVGGKTAINSSYGKNIIGAFWQPKAVIMDLELLKTLPEKEIINGFFEAIKIFLTSDKEYFQLCEENLAVILNLQVDILDKVLARAIALKAHIVEVDEYEKNLRMVLNYGHTVAHAIEKVSNYKVMHGYAVALGMLVEAKIAELSGLLSAAGFIRIKVILGRLGVTAQLLNEFAAEDLTTTMRGDKKNKEGQIFMVLLTAIGEVKNLDNKIAFPVAEELIISAIRQLQGE